MSYFKRCVSYSLSLWKHKYSLFKPDVKPLGRWSASLHNPENESSETREKIEEFNAQTGNTQHCGDRLCSYPKTK